jgi:hypothetical protein
MKPVVHFRSTAVARIMTILMAVSCGAVWITQAAAADPDGDLRHIWQKIEITLHAKNTYKNPYNDLTVWVDLKGPGFEKRCYGFWDGEDTYRIRVLATAAGNWTWQSGSRPEDPGLSGMRGSFEAIDWSDGQKQENPNRRGMIQATPNGHAFQYADGTPYFLLGDTWWAAPTARFRWQDDGPRPLAPGAGFQDFVAYRHQQAYNCVAMIAAFPSWHNDDQPATLKMSDGTFLRAAWREPSKNDPDAMSAKTMIDEAGNRPFLFPGKVPGFEGLFPDLERINPAYFQSMDQKIDYLNAQGFVPFIEVTRRDIGQAWKKFYPWPDSYTRFIQYIWSRYQANICLFSPIHFDSSEQSIPAADWNLAANRVIEQYGPPPFGTLAGTNSPGSSLELWGHTDKAKWLTFHQIGNKRNHDCYELLTKIFQTNPPVPGINGEPYYDGMQNAAGGSELAALYCRSAMYGSVLSGGLGGHIYGAGSWNGGIWSGEPWVATEDPMWKAFAWPSADQMRHLKKFVMSAGRRYQELVPSVAMVEPNKSEKPNGLTGWAYAARTEDRGFVLLYFEKDCPQATLSGLRPRGAYQAVWFDPRTGAWLELPARLIADADGRIVLPAFPGSEATSSQDWGMKLTLAD